MMITREEIREWLKEGIEKGASHVIVVCDTFSYEYYPVFVYPTEDVAEIVKHYRAASMQRVEEIYDLSLPLESQLNEIRAGIRDR